MRTGLTEALRVMRHLGADDWHRAIYIDFEGRVKDPASFLGCCIDQQWSVAILEEALWPAVERGHTRGEIHAQSLVEVLQDLQSLARRENRIIAAWSNRERNEIVATPGLDESSVVWWQENLVNALPVAKDLARELNIDVETRPSLFGNSPNKASLASFMEATGYQVPKTHGPGHSADRILTVRKQLQKKKSYELLSAAAKRDWTNALSHNFHDCVGFAHVMARLHFLEEISRTYVATSLTVDSPAGYVPISRHADFADKVVHIITAWNPGLERPTDEANRTANEKLRTEALKLGAECTRAIGRDPISSHYEESWAVTGLSDRKARSLGRKFRQVAIFRVNGSAQTVLSCDGVWERSRDV